MFYCLSCKEQGNWSSSTARAYGQCDACGDMDLCEDVPSPLDPTPNPAEIHICREIYLDMFLLRVFQAKPSIQEERWLGNMKPVFTFQIDLPEEMCRGKALDSRSSQTGFETANRAWIYGLYALANLLNHLATVNMSKQEEKHNGCGTVSPNEDRGDQKQPHVHTQRQSQTETHTQKKKPNIT